MHQFILSVLSLPLTSKIGDEKRAGPVLDVGQDLRQREVLEHGLEPRPARQALRVHLQPDVPAGDAEARQRGSADTAPGCKSTTTR